MITKITTNRIEVKVPFEMKDEFKAKMETAKWDGDSKTWYVEYTQENEEKIRAFSASKCIPCNYVAPFLIKENNFKKAKEIANVFISNITDFETIIQEQHNKVISLEEIEAFSHIISKRERIKLADNKKRIVTKEVSFFDEKYISTFDAYVFLLKNIDISEIMSISGNLNNRNIFKAACYFITKE